MCWYSFGKTGSVMSAFAFKHLDKNICVFLTNRGGKFIGKREGLKEREPLAGIVGKNYCVQS